MALVENQANDLGVTSLALNFLAGEGWSVLGNDFHHDTGFEHELCIQHCERCLVAHNRIRGDEKHVIKLHNSGYTRDGWANYGVPTKHVVISDNHLLGDEAWIAAIHEQNPDEGGAFEGIIFDRNFVETIFNDRVPRTGVRINAVGGSIWNNIFLMRGAWGLIGANIINYGATDIKSANMRFDNNTCYTPDGGSFKVYCVASSSGAGHFARNNVLYAPQRTGNRAVVDGEGITSGKNLLATSNPFSASSPTRPEDFAPGGDGVLNGRADLV